MGMISLLVVLACCVCARANMYYFSHSPQSIPGNYSVYSYDSDTQDLKELHTDKESSYTAWAMVSGSATCGSRYYASAVDVPIAAAMLITELDSGKTSIFDWTNFGGGNDNLHNMYCDTSDSSGQSLFVVSNVIGGSGYQFSLSKMKIDSDYKFTMDKIADFPIPKKAVPTAYDTEFQMSPDLKTMYALWTNQQMTFGWIQTLDVSSGSVKTYSLPTGGVPYSLLVDSKGDMVLVSFETDRDGVNEYTKCKLSLADGNAKTSDCEVDNTLFTSGQPWTTQLSDGNFYAVSKNVGSASQSKYQNTGAQGIVTISAEGSVVDTLAFDDIFKGVNVPAGTFGGLSVVVSSSSLRGTRQQMDPRKAQCQLVCSRDEACLKRCYSANYGAGKMIAAPSVDPALGRAGFVIRTDQQKACVAKCNSFEAANEDLLRGCYHKCR